MGIQRHRFSGGDEEAAEQGMGFGRGYLQVSDTYLTQLIEDC